MARKTVTHKGYYGSIEVDTSDFSLSGKILFIDEEIVFKGETFPEFEAEFQKKVEKHIHDCHARGEAPPFSDD